MENRGILCENNEENKKSNYISHNDNYAIT